VSIVNVHAHLGQPEKQIEHVNVLEVLEGVNVHLDSDVAQIRKPFSAKLFMQQPSFRRLTG